MPSVKIIQDTDLVFDSNTPNDKICEFIKIKLGKGEYLELNLPTLAFYGDEFSVDEEWEDEILIVSFLNDEVQESLTLKIITLEIINL